MIEIHWMEHESGRGGRMYVREGCEEKPDGFREA